MCADPQPITSETTPFRLAVVTCAVMETEVEHLLPGMDHVAEYHKLEQGLHNEPDRLRQELQAKIDQIESTGDANAIALVYGLCSRGIEGLTAQRCSIAITRAHDCITLLLGSRERYQDYVDRYPGTYWYSPGWNRHHTPPGPQRYEKLYRAYVDKYGEDNAEFLMETEQHWFSTYNRAVYVHLTVGATEEDRAYSKGCADWLNWQYDEQTGDPALLRALLSGQWNDKDFLVIRPGQTLQLAADEGVVRAVEVVDD